MSEAIKMKAPRTKKQVFALEKARTRAKEIRQQKITDTKKEIESDDAQERINALNSRSTRLKSNIGIQIPKNISNLKRRKKLKKRLK